MLPRSSRSLVRSAALRRKVRHILSMSMTLMCVDILIDVDVKHLTIWYDITVTSHSLHFPPCLFLAYPLPYLRLRDDGRPTVR